MSKKGAIIESVIMTDRNTRKYKPLNIDRVNMIRLNRKATIPIFI